MGIPSQLKLSAKPALVKDGGSHARLLASGYQLHQLRQPIDHTIAARTGTYLIAYITTAATGISVPCYEISI
jgi:hypothetical protein